MLGLCNLLQGVTVSLSLSLCRSVTVSLCHCVTVSLSLCHSVTMSLCHCHSVTLTVSLCHSVTVSLSLCHSVTLSLCQTAGMEMGRKAVVSYCRHIVVFYWSDWRKLRESSVSYNECVHWDLGTANSFIAYREIISLSNYVLHLNHKNTDRIL